MSGTISRRTAMQHLAAAAAVLAGTGSGLGARAAESAVPQPRKGSVNHSVCRWCYNSMPLEALAQAVQAMGVRSIELLDPEDWPVVRKYGLTCAMANGPSTIPQGFNRVENHSWLVPGYRERLRAAAEAGLPNVIAFSGNRDGMDDEEGLEHCVTGLQQIMPAAEQHGVTVCMELLNSKVDHPDYMCDHTAWGVELVERVGSERFKLLYDIYHMQIMEGDVIRTIRDHHDAIGHYHTGGNPGRHEIDATQELNYPAIVRAIRDTGFQGYVAQEFIPTRDPMTSLREAIALCDV